MGDMARARTAGAEYARLVADGRVVEAEQVRRTIETLVGYFECGALWLPHSVAEVMGRTDLASPICRAHDADDPIGARVCGGPLPCPEHP
jgi:hypothetical protein